MKHIVGVSLGSSKRDHRVEIDLLGEHFIVERRGTDGDEEAAIRLIGELDGKVDAFGLGGTDLYLVSHGRRYMIRDAAKLARAAKETPIVDGSGLKDTLERRVVHFLAHEAGLPVRDRNVLIVSAMDRFGMAESFHEEGARLTLGDLIFALGIDIPIHSLRTLDVLARIAVPVVVQLPFEMLYPVGSEQEKIDNKPKYAKYYLNSDWIAGDWHYIHRHLPDQLRGQMILTNTVTAKDVDLLRARGASLLVTTTPELEGRSFGTNVMEALLVAASGRRPEELTTNDYERLLDELGFRPRVEPLSPLGDKEVVQ